MEGLPSAFDGEALVDDAIVGDDARIHRIRTDAGNQGGVTISKTAGRARSRTISLGSGAAACKAAPKLMPAKIIATRNCQQRIVTSTSTVP